MRLIIHGQSSRLADSVESICQAIREETLTRDLVVSVYLPKKSTWSGGVAYARDWVTPKHYFARRGKWRLFPEEPMPVLPDRFKLIRLCLVPSSRRYPLREKDCYHWVHRYERWADHLAFLFAHELHHYRRYHLGLHPREGEHSANRWAVERCQQQGFRIESWRDRQQSSRRKRRSRQTETNWTLWINPKDFIPMAQPNRFDTVSGLYSWILDQLGRGKQRQSYQSEKHLHFERLRALSPGAMLTVDYDPRDRYTGQQVRVIRVLNRNSVRIVIRTPDGRDWRWPMAWLKE
jgi:hypothetical protein